MPAAGDRVESLMKTKRWDLFIVVMVGAVLVLVFVATNVLDLFGLADDGPKAGKGAAARPEMNYVGLNDPISAHHAPTAGMVLVPEQDGPAAKPMSEKDLETVDVAAVRVPAFHMDGNLVSWRLWQKVAGWVAEQQAAAATRTNCHPYDLADHPPALPAGNASNAPVEVAWLAAAKWCNARSEQEGKTPVYYLDATFTNVFYRDQAARLYPNWQAQGYRLPADAEWEKAARGREAGEPPGMAPGTTPRAAAPGAAPVSRGSLAPNGYGLYNLAQELPEWCWGAAYATDVAGPHPRRGPLTNGRRATPGEPPPPEAQYTFRCVLPASR